MKKGINRNNLDTAINPRDNFYGYSCGGWQREHPLKGEFASFGTFNLINEESLKQVRELIENLKSTPEAQVKDTLAQKIGDLYEMGLDMERRNREGATPLLPLVDKVNAMTLDELPAISAWLLDGIDQAFFSLAVGADHDDANMNIMHIGEAGLGLGDRDYYLEENETNARIMEAYREYIVKIMQLVGYDLESAERVRDNVLAIEHEMAKNKMSREMKRDPMNRHNPLSASELADKYPNLKIAEITDLYGIKMSEKVNILSPAYLEFINDYLPTLSLQQVKDYIVFGVVSNSTGVLSDDFYDADFELYGRVMSGREEQKPQWKRAMGIPESMFGEAIGKLYVEKYFPPQNKEYMLGLVENLRDSLGKHIRQLDWMSNATKEKALAKLAAMRVKIGYPDKWKNYDEIHIDPSKSYQENVLAASRWVTRDAFSKIGKPVDKDEWFMYPQTVNAYYAPMFNEICFPAGLLQPPFFDIEADDAINYGAIGVVIGHEMTHGFDDSGRQFDVNGNLANWWTDEDEKKFNELTAVLEKQFDEVEVAPGVHANGKFTLGENIADQGGLRVALTAYQDHCAESQKDIIDGYTPLQRFYLSYAGVWANNIRPEEILERTKTDPHSLGVNRVNVTLRNIAPFYQAFDVKEGDKMFLPKSERVIIW